MSIYKEPDTNPLLSILLVIIIIGGSYLFATGVL